MTDRVKKSRLLLQNPYAYVGENGFEYIDPQVSGKSHTTPQNKAKLVMPPPAIDPRISKNRQLLENPYAFLDGDGNFAFLEHSTKSTTLSELLTAANPAKKSSYSDNDIEKVVRELLNAVWKNRDLLWKGAPPTNPTELLSPTTVLTGLGYHCEYQSSLGHSGTGASRFKVAGYIDDGDEKKVIISKELPYHTQNFTAAHELAHAILHEAHGLHRERAVDGTNMRGGTEREADKFASLFLMPERWIRKQFKGRFLCDSFGLTPETIFALNSSLSGRKINTIRDLSRVLASAESYNYKNFTSLARQLNVSEEAMAIRLEELNLVSF